MERLFLTPSKRRVDHSTPEEAFEARKWNKKPEFSLKPRPSTYDEEYTTFRLREPILTSPRGLVRTPLAELPKHEFAVRSRRSPKESLTTHTQASRAAAPVARRTPPARSSTRGHQLNPVTPPAQSAQVRVTPSTSNSSQSSISVCSICGSTYVCSRCSPNTSIQSSRSSMPSSSSSQNSASSQSRAELDRNVRKMERLAAKGRKLRDLIPSMAASSDVPKTWRQKTEVEKWLEKEMAIQEHAYEH
ncbi:hypothetical protein EV426DRAFT_612374 [Tirmania nivea]|nr:hypothetical protein EV426DRAFT_612374 [Tirmania nivea]